MNTIFLLEPTTPSKVNFWNELDIIDHSELKIETLNIISINHLEEVEEETDDATNPGHQGAGSHLLLIITIIITNNNNAHRLVPNHCREHLRCVDEYNPPNGAGPELAEEGE